MSRVTRPTIALSGFIGRVDIVILLLASTVLAAWILLKVFARRRSDEFETRVALRAALDSGTFLIPIASAGAAAFVAGRFYGGRQAEQRHLEGFSRRLFTAVVAACATPLTITLICVAVVTTVGSSLLTGNAHYSVNQGLVTWAGLTVMMGPVLWCFLGAAAACLIRNRIATMLLLSVVLLFAFAGQRLATYQPAALTLYSLSPNGAWSALLTGQAILYFPGSEQSFAVSATSLAVWLVLAVLALRARNHHRRRRTRSAQLASPKPVTWQVRACVGVVTSLVVGLTVPYSMAQHLPWDYRYSWLQMKVNRSTPADAATDLVVVARTEGVPAATARTRPDSANKQSLAQQIGVLATSADLTSVENLIDAPGPGRVAVNMGRAVQEGDVQVLPEQWMLCFSPVTVGDSVQWKLRAVGQNGGDCG